MSSSSSPSSSSSLMNISLKILRNAFPINLPSYKEIAPIATRLKTTGEIPQSAKSKLQTRILTVNKDMQTLTMEDIKKLIIVDSKYKNVKFNLFTDDRALAGHKIHPLIRLLLNNGMTFTIHNNNGHQTMNALNNMEDVKEVREQIYMELTRRTDPTHGETVLFREIDVNHNSLYSKIPFKVEDQELEFLTPSLGILPRLGGLGIHKSHPEFAKLIGKKAIISEIKPNPINFYEVQEEQIVNDTNGIIGLFPQHIKSHKGLTNFATDYVEPGKKIKFNGEYYDYLQICDIMAEKFPTAQRKFIEVIPFVAQNYYQKTKKLTKRINNHVVFDPLQNETLEFPIDHENRGLAPSTKQFIERKIPFNRIGFRDVLNYINFKNSYKFEQNLGFSMNADLLRSHLLHNHYIQLNRFRPIYSNLETLTFICERFLTLEDKEYELKNDELDNMDLFLMDAYFKLIKNQKDVNIGKFTSYHLINYMIYTDLVQTEHSRRFLNYIFLRFFNNQVRYHYPSFYNYYRIKFEEVNPEISTEPFKIETGPTLDHELSFFRFLHSVYSEFNEVPNLYAFKLFTKQKRKSFKIDKYKPKKLVKALIDRFNGQDFKLPELVHSQEIFFKSDEIVVFKYIPLSRLELIKRLKQLDFHTEATEPLENLKLRLRLILIEDLEQFQIRSNFTVDFVDELLGTLDSHFVKEFEMFKETGDIEGVTKAMDDYEAKINPFVKEITENKAKSTN